MLVSRILNGMNNHCAPRCKLRESFSRNVIRSNSTNETTENSLRKLNELLKQSEQDEWTVLKMFQRKSYKGKGLKLPTPMSYDFKRWWKHNTISFAKFEQRFIPERHSTLGRELAAAHYLVSRGGKVKHEGSNDWIKRNEELVYVLPENYDPNWRMTHIDVSKLGIYYEGIDNLRDLSKVVWADFSENPHFDDWCIDKICANLRNLQYLDVSGCPKLTERCFEALYKLFDLKTLIITDWQKGIAFELACMMLEDSTPDINIKVRKPPQEQEDTM